MLEFQYHLITRMLKDALTAGVCVSPSLGVRPMLRRTINKSKCSIATCHMVKHGSICPRQALITRGHNNFTLSFPHFYSFIIQWEMKLLSQIFNGIKGVGLRVVERTKGEGNWNACSSTWKIKHPKLHFMTGVWFSFQYGNCIFRFQITQRTALPSCDLTKSASRFLEF